jgi:hypothetical protein
MLIPMRRSRYTCGAAWLGNRLQQPLPGVVVAGAAAAAAAAAPMMPHHCFTSAGVWKAALVARTSQQPPSAAVLALVLPDTAASRDLAGFAWPNATERLLSIGGGGGGGGRVLVAQGGAGLPVMPYRITVRGEVGLLVRHLTFSQPRDCAVSYGANPQPDTAPSSWFRRWGGAVSVANGAVLQVTHCRFLDLQADFGGAVSVSSSQARVEDCTFARCHADFGGAIRAESSRAFGYFNLTIVRSSFLGNYVKCHDRKPCEGGALNVDGHGYGVGDAAGALLRVENSELRHNSVVMNTATLADSGDAATDFAIGGWALKINYMQPSRWSFHNTTIAPFGPQFSVAASLSGTPTCAMHPCPVGHACAAHSASLWCSKCSQTQVSPDGIACVACPAGLEPSADSAQCVQCPPGRYSDGGLATATCIECRAGKIAVGTTNRAGNTRCEACPLTAVPSANGRTCVCPTGRYNRTDGVIMCFARDYVGDSLDLRDNFILREQLGQGEICLTCPPCVSCLNGSTTIKNGYGLSSATASPDLALSRSTNGVARSVFLCEETAACDHSLDMTFEKQMCAPGNSGPLCALCLPGFGRYGGTRSCRPCDYVASAWLWWLGFSVGFIIFGLLPLMLVLRGKCGTRGSHLQSSQQMRRRLGCCPRAATAPLDERLTVEAAANPLSSLHMLFDEPGSGQLRASVAADMGERLHRLHSDSTGSDSRVAGSHSPRWLFTRLVFQPLKILLSYAQVLGSLGSVLHLELPPFMDTVHDIARAFIFDVQAIVQLDCWSSVQFYTLWLIKVVAIPMASMLAVEAFFQVKAFALHRKLESARGDGMDQEEGAQKQRLHDQVKPLAAARRTHRFFALFLVYPTICNQVFGIFDCRTLEWLGTEMQLLVEDYSVTCDTPTHHIYWSFSILVIVFVVFGVPMYCLVQLIAVRSERNGPKNVFMFCLKVLCPPIVMCYQPNSAAETEKFKDFAAIARQVGEQCDLAGRVTALMIRDIISAENYNFLMDAFRSDFYYWE